MKLLRHFPIISIFFIGLACGGGSLISPPASTPEGGSSAIEPINHVVNVRNEGDKTILSGNVMGSANLGDPSKNVILDKSIILGPGTEVNISANNLNVVGEMRVMGTLRIQ